MGSIFTKQEYPPPNVEDLVARLSCLLEGDSLSDLSGVLSEVEDCIHKLFDSVKLIPDATKDHNCVVPLNLFAKEGVKMLIQVIGHDPTSSKDCNDYGQVRSTACLALSEFLKSSLTKFKEGSEMRKQVEENLKGADIQVFLKVFDPNPLKSSGTMATAAPELQV